MPVGAQIAALCGTAFLLIAVAVLVARQIKGTPEKRERKRRLMVNMEGRLGDAFITEASDCALYYSYSVEWGSIRGVPGRDDSSPSLAAGT